MGALPKNKVTRTEQGKRRQGNRPHLSRDAKVGRVPLARRGLVASISRAIGLLGSSKTKALPAAVEPTSKPKAIKHVEEAALSAIPKEPVSGVSAAQTRPSRASAKAVTTAKRTDVHHAQHKG